MRRSRSRTRSESLKGNKNSIGNSPWNKGHTKETDIRLQETSKRMMGHKYNQGRHHTEEALKKMRGRKRTEESKAKQRGLNTWMKGKHLSEETKRKMGDSKRGIKRTEESKSKTRGKNHYNWKGGYQNTLMYNRKRRAMKNGVEGSHTLSDWELLKKQYGYKCPCCDKIEPDITLAEDHIIPISKGGSNYIENIQPLCKSCNSKKRTKIIKFAKGV